MRIPTKPIVVLAAVVALGAAACASEDEEAGVSEEETPQARIDELRDEIEALASENDELAERAETAERRADELEAELETFEEFAAAAEEAEAQAEAEAEAAGIGPGVHVVGTDIAAGTYRTAGPSDSAIPNCYWARLSGLSGELDEIITNGLPQGPATVQIQESDAAFETSGCERWDPVA